jgi:hypothetical protein
MRLLTADEAAERLLVKPCSLQDKRFRARLGLPIVRIGRYARFSEDDIERVIEKGREPAGAQGEVSHG